MRKLLLAGEPADDVVLEQKRRSSVCGEQQIQAPVIVDVAISCATANARRIECGAKSLRYFLKIAFADVAKQVRRHGILHVWLHALDIAIDVAIGDEDVRPTVQVIIKKEATKAEG